MPPPASSRRARPTPAPSQLSSKPPWRTPHHTLESTWGWEFLLTLPITISNVWQIVSIHLADPLSRQLPTFLPHSITSTNFTKTLKSISRTSPITSGFGYVSWIYDNVWKLTKSYSRQCYSSLSAQKETSITSLGFAVLKSSYIGITLHKESLG